MIANNNMKSTLSLAILRAMYQANIFPLLEGGRADPAIKDINSYELQYYGKINKIGLPIFPNDDFMTAFSMDRVNNSTKQSFGFDFVTRMYDEVKETLAIKSAVGTIPTIHNAINKMPIVTSYIPPKVQYALYLKNLIREFNSTIFGDTYNNITHFEGYVNAIYEYFLNLDERTPITFSGWMTSKESSIFSTGLAFSIMDNAYDNDDSNSKFAYNLLFPMFKKLAMNNGFCLVKQAPWIMIADIGSPAIVKHYNNNINNSLNVIETYYNLCYQEDIFLLYDNLINLYNDIVLVNNEVKSKSVSCNNKTVMHKSIRQFIPDGDMTYRNPNRYFTMYCNLRNFEEGRPLTDDVLRQEIKKAKNLLDNNASMNYINRIFAAELFKKPFGLNHMIRRFESVVTSKRGIGATEQEKQQSLGTGLIATGGSMGGGGSSGGY